MRNRARAGAASSALEKEGDKSCYSQQKRSLVFSARELETRMRSHCLLSWEQVRFATISRRTYENLALAGDDGRCDTVLLFSCMTEGSMRPARGNERFYETMSGPSFRAHFGAALFFGECPPVALFHFRRWFPSFLSFFHFFFTYLLFSPLSSSPLVVCLLSCTNTQTLSST